MRFNPDHQTILWNILKWRRDVRHFKSDPIPPETLDRLRAAIDFAPSVGNARPWRFIRVTSPSLRAKIRDNFTSSNENAGEVYENERREAYFDLKLAGLDRAPEQFAVFTEIDPLEGYGLGRQTMPDTLRQSCAMAIYTFWLAARVENLGLGMVSILQPDAIKRLLEVPPTWEFAAYLCLGFAEADDDTPLLHRANWQHNQPAMWLEK